MDCKTTSEVPAFILGSGTQHYFGVADPNQRSLMELPNLRSRVTERESPQVTVLTRPTVVSIFPVCEPGGHHNRDGMTFATLRVTIYRPVWKRLATALPKSEALTLADCRAV